MSRRHLTLGAASLALFTTLTATCVLLFPRSPASRIQPGMTEAEVLSILGIESFESLPLPSLAVDDNRYTYSSRINAKPVSVTFSFADGRVVKDPWKRQRWPWWPAMQPTSFGFIEPPDLQLAP